MSVDKDEFDDGMAKISKTQTDLVKMREDLDSKLKTCKTDILAVQKEKENLSKEIASHRQEDTQKHQIMEMEIEKALQGVSQHDSKFAEFRDVNNAEHHKLRQQLRDIEKQLIDHTRRLRTLHWVENEVNKVHGELENMHEEVHILESENRKAGYGMEDMSDALSQIQEEQKHTEERLGVIEEGEEENESTGTELSDTDTTKSAQYEIAKQRLATLNARAGALALTLMACAPRRQPLRLATQAANPYFVAV